MIVVRTVEDLRRHVGSWRGEGARIGLVPTMGALHDGHMALVAASQSQTERTVATLFVNPKQFGEGEDLDAYPRDEAADRAKLESAAVDVLFAPSVDEMYGSGHLTGVTVACMGDVLEGEHRPGFFDGVATVVAKLLNQSGADVAFFGEKDFQQLQLIKRMARDLNIPTAVEGVATVRQDDGLALSSRNAYLTVAERAAAPALFGVLLDVARVAGADGDVHRAEQEGRQTLLAAGFADIDYLCVCDAATFEPAQNAGGGRVRRALAAATLGRARLIDNVAV